MKNLTNISLQKCLSNVVLHTKLSRIAEHKWESVGLASIANYLGSKFHYFHEIRGWRVVLIDLRNSVAELFLQYHCSV